MSERLVDKLKEMLLGCNDKTQPVPPASPLIDSNLSGINLNKGNALRDSNLPAPESKK